jgi:hypothetical protein
LDFRFDFAALCALFAVILWLIYRRDRARKTAVRAAFLDDCRPLLAEVRVRAQAGAGYPVLEGHYAGHPVRIEPVIDHMGVRKLPSLWVMVSLFGDVPISGTVDFLMRPQNTEFSSPSAALPISLRIPPHWPQHALLRTDMQDRDLAIALLEPHIDFFQDEKAKEVLVARRGVRLVYQATQGERAYYAVLRRPEFGETRLPVETARMLLEHALTLYNSASRIATASLNSGPPEDTGARSSANHGAA